MSSKFDISRRDFMRTAASGAVLISACSLLKAEADGQFAKRPNIIFLQDDQHRWDHIGKINPGVKTPALDRIAADGILFDQATCQCPMCVPSRYSLMLGLYPKQTGVLTNLGRLSDEQLPCDTLAEILRKAGYQTAGFGKTHWNVKGCLTRGFEVRSIGQPASASCFETGAVMMGDRNPEGLKRYDAETAEFGSGEEGIPGYIGCTSKVPEGDHRDGWVFNECLKFIDSGVSGDKPLFLYLSFFKPHAGLNIPAGFEELYDIKSMPVPAQPEYHDVEPCHASRSIEQVASANMTGKKQSKVIPDKTVQERIDFWSKASKEQWQQLILRYRANCSWIDSLFGRVMEKLKQKGVLDNCIIVYTSDHGDMLGERYYRFTKYCLYDPSVRVPLIIGGTAVPGDQKGTIDSRPAELVDVLPTILKAAGVESSVKRPGFDLLGAPSRTGTFCEFHDLNSRDSFMWRTATHKLILSMKKKARTESYGKPDILAGELYDLKGDSREWKNLFDDAQYAGVKEELTRSLLNHLASLQT